MRNLRFRAWVPDCDPDSCEHYKMIEFSIFNDFKDSIYDNKDEICVMQYTGQRDWKGKMIYEGDILEYTSNFGEKTTTKNLTVDWSNVDSAFLFGNVRTDYAVKNSVVIGNIFENPELIS